MPLRQILPDAASGNAPITARVRATVQADAPLILLLFLTLFALAPLFSSDYFYTAHDGRHGVFYLLQFDASIQDGAYWPRWAMHHNQGYGYPTFLIQAPLAFYIAELFVLLGAGYTTAVKLTWIAGFLLSGWGMYSLVVHWLRAPEDQALDQTAETRTVAPTKAQLAGLVAGLAYIYFPYRLVDTYVRAALSDTLLLAWFPWVILAFDRLILHGLNQGWQRRCAFSILMLAGTLLTHTFALLSFLPLLITFVLFRLWLVYKEEKIQPPEPSQPDTSISTHQPALPDTASFRRKTLPRISTNTSGRNLLWGTILAGAAGVGAILLAANFIFPLLAEGPLLQRDVYTTRTYDFRSHFVYFGQFFSPFWGFGFSDDPSGSNDGMSFQIGIMLVLPALVALLLLGGRLFKQDESRHHRRGAAILLYLLIISALVMLMMTPAARLIWANVTPLAVIQFPWRLLSLVGFTISALVGITAYFLSEKFASGRHANYDLVNDRITSDQKSAFALHDQSGLVLLGLLILFASVGYIDANLSSVEGWREDGRAIFRFETEHPDMLGYTQYVEEPFTESPMTADYASEDYVEDYGEEGVLTRLAILPLGDSGGILESGVTEISLVNGEVLSHYSRGSSAGGVVRLNSDSVVRIHVYYFPGWQVRIDGEIVEHRLSDPHGLIEVDVPSGTHQIDARMGSTPVRRVGAIVSILMGLLVMGLLVWKKRNKEVSD